MTSSKRIIVTLSKVLLSEVDYFTAMEKRNRSDIVRDAIEYYLDKRKREVLFEQMKNGYLEMAFINLTFACEIFDLEENQECYEYVLSEWHHI